MTQISTEAPIDFVLAIADQRGITHLGNGLDISFEVAKLFFGITGVAERELPDTEFFIDQYELEGGLFVFLFVPKIKSRITAIQFPEIAQRISCYVQLADAVRMN